MAGAAKRRKKLLSFLGSTSRRIFYVYPPLLIVIELLLQGGALALNFWGLLLLVWGYLQYRIVRRYRLRRGGGGPGMDAMPDRIVTDGPYRYVRNPIYLGQLIFLAGLAVSFLSWIGLALLILHIPWFHFQVLKDEAKLEQHFGTTYVEYKRSVKRWIPGII